jgi:hypothetical protein
VFCGHAGKSAQRQDRGVHGNLITSLLLTMHDNRTNPLRMVQINTAQNSLKTWVYSPYTNTNYPSYTRQFNRLSWVR